jgi:hypothetical protein
VVGDTFHEVPPHHLCWVCAGCAGCVLGVCWVCAGCVLGVCWVAFVRATLLSSKTIVGWLGLPQAPDSAGPCHVSHPATCRLLALSPLPPFLLESCVLPIFTTFLFLLLHSSEVLLDLCSVVRLGGWLELSVSCVKQSPLGDFRPAKEQPLTRGARVLAWRRAGHPWSACGHGGG